MIATSAPRLVALLTALPLAVLSTATSLSGCSNSSQPSAKRANETPREPKKGEQDPEALRESRLAHVMSRVLQEGHLRSQPIDDTVSKKAFAVYLEQLDPGKQFLLQEHVAQLQKHELMMDDQMRMGKLLLAHEGSLIFQERLAVVKALVAELLAKPLDFTDEESMQLDPDKLAFSANEKELRNRWRQSLELQVLSRVDRMEKVAEARAKLGKDKRRPAPRDSTHSDVDEDVPTTFEGREAKARAKMAEIYNTRFTRLAQVERIDRVDAFLNALTRVYDPHTVYMQPQRKENFDIEMSGSLEGIGALLGEDEHFIKIISIVPGSASWQQGDLEAGDLILSVGQGDDEPVDIGDMPLRDVVRMIRGKKGTKVVLTVKKPDERVLEIAIVRDVVKMSAAYAKGAVLDHPASKQRIGYIHVPSFYGNTRAAPGGTPQRNCTEDVNKLLGHFGELGLSQVILDLRGNGGGLLGDARDMSGLFIETGPIVQTREADGSHQVLVDIEPSVAFRGQLVVMVDRFSASAAEIVAAALQDYGRAVIVGTGPTHGKGSVQVLFGLDRMVPPGAPEAPPLGVVKLTQMEFYRVTGASTQRRGVTPDILLPDPNAEVESGERFLDGALPWSEIEGQEYQRWSAPLGDVRELARKSQERQARSPAFKAVTKRADMLRARSQDTVEPLQLAAWRAKRESERKALEALTDELDKSEAALKVAPVDYDGTSKERIKERPKSEHRSSEAGERRSSEEPWQADLARDPWLEEAVFILGDMSRP